MKIFFAGTPEIAVRSLKAIAAGFEVCGVLTNPDRPAGRKGIVKPSPVKTAALELGLEVFQPEKLDSVFLAAVKYLSPDVLVTFAYGKIFKKDFLDLFVKETLNIHPSLLPMHRGPSPLNAAILSGMSETGITIQRMALKMDSGDILAQVSFPLNGDETLESLSDAVSAKSAKMITALLGDIESGNYTSTPQNESAATYCRLVEKNDGLINWSESAVMIERKSRAYHPWPGIFTYWKGKQLAITVCRVSDSPELNPSEFSPGEVAGIDRKEGILIKTGDRFLAVTELKPQSKNNMDFKSFINGARDFAGSRLTGPQ